MPQSYLLSAEVFILGFLDFDHRRNYLFIWDPPKEGCCGVRGSILLLQKFAPGRWGVCNCGYCRHL